MVVVVSEMEDPVSGAKGAMAVASICASVSPRPLPLVDDASLSEAPSVLETPLLLEVEVEVVDLVVVEVVDSGAKGSMLVLSIFESVLPRPLLSDPEAEVLDLDLEVEVLDLEVVEVDAKGSMLVLSIFESELPMPLSPEAGSAAASA